jgi:hypothetical protein
VYFELLKVIELMFASTATDDVAIDARIEFEINQIDFVDIDLFLDFIITIIIAVTVIEEFVAINQAHELNVVVFLIITSFMVAITIDVVAYLDLQHFFVKFAIEASIL